MPLQPTSYFDIGIHIHIETFSEYLDVISTALKAQRSGLEAHLSREALGLDPQTRDELYDHYSDQHHNLAFGFPARFFNSFIIALCSWIESELDGLVRQYERDNTSALKLEDVAGKGLRRSSLYLKRVAGLDFPGDRGEWFKILILYRIRNQIAHAAGASSKLEPPERQLLAQWSCDGHDGIHRIGLNEPFCRMALESARAFFSDLDAVLPDGLTNW